MLDEPTTGQDAPGLFRVESIVRELADAGRTIVAISHDMRFVADVFERVVVMRAGKVVLDGPPAEVFAEAAWPTLASTFLNRRWPRGSGRGSDWARRLPKRPWSRCCATSRNP